MSRITERLKKLEQHKKIQESGVFFVGVENGEYTVIAAPDKMVFQGDKTAYKAFTQSYGESVFIVDDIPREVKGINLLDWI